MYNLIPQRDLMGICDQIAREITPQETGVRLLPDSTGPGGACCTAWILFEKGFRMALSVCAERAALIRMAQHVMQTEEIGPRDIEDVAKEYLNVLCGHFVSRLFRLTRIPARFSVPVFCEGRRAPEGYRAGFALTYVGDGGERLQLTHYLPLETDDLPETDEKGSRFMKKQVMVVDDSRMTELQIRKFLEGSDFELAAYCDNGEDAIARYGEVRPDVVTMDIIMPGIDGLETAKIILEEHPDARIVMVSSLIYDDTISEAQKVGAKTFLYKPLTREALLRTLEEVTAPEDEE